MIAKMGLIKNEWLMDRILGTGLGEQAVLLVVDIDFIRDPSSLLDQD